jgi:hypothetical protein
MVLLIGVVGQIDGQQVGGVVVGMVLALAVNGLLFASRLLIEMGVLIAPLLGLLLEPAHPLLQLPDFEQLLALFFHLNWQFNQRTALLPRLT